MDKTKQTKNKQFVEGERVNHFIPELDFHDKYEPGLEEYFLLLEHSIDLISIIGFDRKFLKVNRAWESVLGWSEEEMLGKEYLGFIHPDDLQETLNVANKNRENGEAVIEFTNRYRCKDGTFRWLSWNAIPIPERKITISIARDITTKVDTESALAESEKRLMLLFDNTQDMITLTDESARAIWGNPAWKRVFGTDIENREDPFRLIHPNDLEKVAEAWDEMVAGQSGLQNLVYRFRLPDGTYGYFASSAFPVIINGTQRYYVIARDITERELAKLSLQDAHDSLESRVKERTEELEKLVDLMAGREVRMAELKRVIKKLRQQIFDLGVEPIADDPLNINL